MARVMDNLTSYTRDLVKRKTNHLQLYKVLWALFPDETAQDIQNQTLAQHESKARQAIGTAINHANTRTTHNAATITTRMDDLDKFFQHIVGAKDRRGLVAKLRASTAQQTNGEILQAQVKKGIESVVACFKEFHRVKGQPGMHAAVLNATYEATFKKHYSDPRNFFALFFSVPTHTSRVEPWLGVHEEGGKFKLRVETKEISNEVKMDGVKALNVILRRAEALVESTHRRQRHNTAQQRAKLKHTLAQTQQHKFTTDSAASVQDAALEQTEWFYEEWCADATSTPQVTPSRVTLQHAPEACPAGGQTCQVKLGIKDVCWKEVHDVGEGNWRTSKEIHVQCSAQPPGPLLTVAQLQAWVEATPNPELQELLDETLLYTDARLCVDVQSGGIDMARIFYEAVRPERHVYGGEMPRAEPRGGGGTLVLASPKQCWVCHEVLHITEPACQVCGAHVCPRCETLTSVDKPPQLCVVQPAPEGTTAEVVAQEHRQLVEETRQFLRQHTAMQAARKTAAKEYPLLEFSPSDEVVASVPLYRLQFTLGTGQHKKTVESLDAISLQLKCVDVPYTDALGVLDAGPYRNLTAALDGSPWSRVYYVDHADWHATPLRDIFMENKNGVYLRSQRFKDRAYHIQGVVVRGRPARLHGSGCGRVVPAAAHAPVQELVYASEDSQFHVRFVDSSPDHARNADATLATKELESKQQRVKANDAVLVPLPGADFDGQAGCLWARVSRIKSIDVKDWKKIDENQDFCPALSQDRNFLQMSMEQRLALAGGEEVKATGVLLTHNHVQYAPVSVLAHGTIAHRAPDASGAMLAFVNITSHAHALPWEPATNTLLYEPGDVCVFRRSDSSEASDEPTGVVTKMALKMDTEPTLQWAALDDDDDDDDDDDHGHGHRDKMAAEWEVKPLLQRFVRSLDGAGDIACVNLHGSQLVQRADPGIVAFRPPSPVALARPLVVVEADRRWLLWQPKHMCAHCAAVATHHSCESPYLHPRTGFEMLQHYGNAVSTLVQEPPFASALRDNLTRTERALLAANNVVREPADDFDTRLQSMQSEYRKMCVLHTDLRVKSVYADAAEPDAGARFFYGDMGMREIAFVPLLRAIQDGDSPFFDQDAKARAWLKLCADWEEFLKWKRVYETAVLKVQDEQRNFEVCRDLSPETALRQVIAAVSQFHAGVSSVNEERAVEMLESQVIQFFPSAKNTTSPFTDERKDGVEAVRGGNEGTEGDEDKEAVAGLLTDDENTPKSTQAEQGADNGDEHAALYLVGSAAKRKHEGDASDVQTKKQKNQSHQAVHFLNRALKKIIQESERPSGAPKWGSDIKRQVACLLHGQFEDAPDVQFSPAMQEMFAYSLQKAKESAKDATNNWESVTKEAESALEHIRELQQYQRSEQWEAIQANLADERVQELFREFKMLKELGLRDLENFISPRPVDRLKLDSALPSDPDKAQSALLKAYLLGAKVNTVQEKIMNYVRQECDLTPEKFSTDFFDKTMDDIEKKLTMSDANVPEDANAGDADAEYTPIEVVDTSDSSSSSGDDDDHAADDADFQREFLVKQGFPEQYLSLMGLWREYDPAVDESEENAAGDGDAAMADAGDGDAAMADTGDGDAAMADTGDGNTVTTDAGDGDTATADAGDGNTATTDAGDGNTATTDAGDGDTAMADAGDGNTATTDAGDGDTATTDAGNGDTAMDDTGTPTPAMDQRAAGDHVEGSTVSPEDGVDEILRSSLFVDGTDVMPRVHAILQRSTKDALAEMKRVLQHQVRHGGTLRVPWDFDWFANEKDEGYRGEDEDEDAARQGKSDAPRLVESAMRDKRTLESMSPNSDQDQQPSKKKKAGNVEAKQDTDGAGSKGKGSEEDDTKIEHGAHGAGSNGAGSEEDGTKIEHGTHGAGGKGEGSKGGGTEEEDSDDASSSSGSEEEDSEEHSSGDEEDTGSAPPAPVEKVTVTQALPRHTFRAFCGRDFKGPESSSIHFEQNAIAALMKVHGHEMHVDLDFDENLVLTAHKKPDGSLEYAWLPASEEEQQEIQDQQRVNLSELVCTCTRDFRDRILRQTLSQEQWHEQVAALQTDVMRSTDTAHLRKCQRLRLPASSKGWKQAFKAPEMRCEKMWTWKVDSGEGILFEVSDDKTVEVNADKLPEQMPELTAEGIAANNAAATVQEEALATGINSDTTAGVAGDDATTEPPAGTERAPTGGNGAEKFTETAPAAGDVATAEPPASTPGAPTGGNGGEKSTETAPAAGDVATAEPPASTPGAPTGGNGGEKSTETAPAAGDVATGTSGPSAEGIAANNAAVTAQEEALTTDINGDTMAEAAGDNASAKQQPPASSKIPAKKPTGLEKIQLELDTAFNELNATTSKLHADAAKILDWDGLIRYTKTLDELAITPGACVYVWWLREARHKTHSQPQDFLDTPASRSRFDMWRIAHVQEIDSSQRIVTCWMEGDLEPTKLTREGENTFRTENQARVQLVECPMHANTLNVVMDVQEREIQKSEMTKKNERAKKPKIAVLDMKPLTGIVCESQYAPGSKAFDMACSDLKHLLARGDQWGLLLDSESTNFEQLSNDVACSAWDVNAIRDTFTVDIFDISQALNMANQLKNTCRDVFFEFYRSNDLAFAQSIEAPEADPTQSQNKINKLNEKMKTIRTEMKNLTTKKNENIERQTVEITRKINELQKQLTQKRKEIEADAKTSSFLFGLGTQGIDPEVKELEDEIARYETRKKDTTRTISKQFRDKETSLNAQRDITRQYLDSLKNAKKLGEYATIAQKWGMAGIQLKLEFNAFVQKLLNRMQKTRDQKTSPTDVVQIHWQSSTQVDGVPSFLFREHVPGKTLADPTKYRPVARPTPPQLRLGDCIETAGADARFVTPRKVDLCQLLCVAAEPGPITMEDAWRQGRLHAGEQIRFPLVYATRQRQARMLPWLADETDISLVDRLPALVQKLLTVVADVFSATAPGQDKSLLEAAENAAQGVVTGARNAVTAEDFVQYCLLIGIVKRTLNSTSGKGKRDVKDINERREKDNTESWAPHRERILSQFAAKTQGTAQLQEQFAVETTVTYATEQADFTEEIKFDPVLGIVSALKPSLLVDFWEQYQLSDGYVEPDDDEEDGEDAQGAAYSVEDPSGEDADEAALQMHPLKKLRQQHARGVAVGTKLESESAMANQASPGVLPPEVETAVNSLEKQRGKPKAYSEASKVCEQLVGLLQDKSNSDPATCFYDGRLEFSRAFFGAMRRVGQCLTTEDDGSSKTEATWASTHVLAGLTHFAQTTCASRLLRGEQVGEHDRLFQCLVSLCADATRVLIGLEHRRVWQLWQTCLNTLAGAFLRAEDAGASAQALYHVFDGNYIEGFHMHHDKDLVNDMFAQMHPVTVLGWTKPDHIDDPHVKAMLTVLGKIENASQLDYPDWETLGNAERSRFFFQDTPAGAAPTMRLGWCAFMEAQDGAYAAKRKFNQDKKLVQVRAEQQFFARDGRGGPDPQIRLFEMNARADRMDVHPLLLVFANHVFQRQAMGMSTAVTDTYYITHEDFGREPGARENILACQELMMEEIRSAELCFADSRRGIVQWVRSGDPVSFEGQDGRVCRAELRPLDDAGEGGVDIVKLAQDRTEQTMSLTFAGAGSLTCLSVGVVESLEVVAVGDDHGKVHVKATQHSQASPAAFALPNATVIQGVNFSRDGSELAVLWSGQGRQWLTVLAVRGSSVDATPQEADVLEITLSLQRTRPWTDSAQELSEHGVGSNLSVCTPTYFQFDRFTEIDSEVYTPMLPPLPQFWSNKLSAAKQRLSSLRQRESVMGWQEALVRVIQKLVPVDAASASCAHVAAAIHDKTGYDVCLLHSATEILQDESDPAKYALHFHKSAWIGGRDEDVRGRTVLAGVVEQEAHEHVFCVSSAQDDSVPDADTGGDGGDGNHSDDDGASALAGDQATTDTAVGDGQVTADAEMLDATAAGTAVEGGQVFADDENMPDATPAGTAVGDARVTADDENMPDATAAGTAVEVGQVFANDDEAMPGTTPANSDLRPRRIAQVLASAGQRHLPETPPAHLPEAYYVPVPPASLYVPVHAAPPEHSREDSTAVFHYYVPFQP